MSNRLRYLPFLVIVFINAATLPGQIAEIKRHWPVIRLWHDPAAQMTRLLEDVPYQSLKTAAETLAPDVTVLLVTSGEDVRRREYTTYHRALYLLAPRPVWWFSPAPSDGTWESRWWISRSLTTDNIDAVVDEKTADCLLLVDVAALSEYGNLVKQFDGVSIVQAGTTECLVPTSSPIVNYPASFWPIRMMAVLVIFAFGIGFLTLAARFKGRISGLEKVALAWLLGAGLLSTLMFWLDGFSFSLDSQLVILSIGGGLLIVWQRHFVAQLWTSVRTTVSTFKFDDHGLRKTAVFLLGAFLAFQVIFIVLMAVGRPLTVWDSWVNWGSKGRMIFLENGITPALYADSSRSVMLLGYPLSVPLLEAWLYKWLGAADDRLVGSLFVLTYLALVGFVYGLCRRKGLTRWQALLVMVTAVSLGHIVGLAAAAFTDLWLAALLLVAVVYLVEWLEEGQGGYLVVSVTAAGLLTWFKQEGMILVVVLLISMVLAWIFSWRARDWSFNKLLVSGGAVALAAIVFGGPWLLLVSREATLVSVFVPLTVDNLIANVDRLPVILFLIAKELVNVQTGLVWVAIGVVLLVRRSQWGQMIKRPSFIYLLVPVFYLGIMSLPYLFSDFVPYQQHVLSSFFRINAHILFLVLFAGWRLFARWE